MKRILILALVLHFMSCQSDRSLIFVRDNNYFEPSFRVREIIGRDTFFSLTERYLVFNYATNKEKFKEEALGLICDSLKTNRIILFCDFTFKNSGVCSRGYRCGQFSSADFDEAIFSATWEIEHPDSISLLYEDKSGIREERHKLECSFSALDNGSKDGD